jgi:predicted nucleic acid-binding protein
VKWFKKNERFGKEADLLRKKVLSLESTFYINEWAQLELVRALNKAGYVTDNIIEASDYIDGLIDLEAIKLITVSEVIKLANKLQIELTLYASDAVHLATALYSSSNIFWVDDRHFLKPEVVNIANKSGLEIKTFSYLDR